MSMKHGKYQRHEGAVERKLDRIIELLEIQVKIMTALAVTEMLEDEE
jgi:hypothetical protein|tara:strand:+ start:1240 stop:1380 length:141 start_codon:yes stop_codon:yes gene_type:complete